MAEKTVPSVFAEVVSANPDALAVISAEEKITYGELVARANRIALNLMRHTGRWSGLFYEAVRECDSFDARYFKGGRHHDSH